MHIMYSPLEQGFKVLLMFGDLERLWFGISDFIVLEGKGE